MSKKSELLELHNSDSKRVNSIHDIGMHILFVPLVLSWKFASWQAFSFMMFLHMFLYSLTLCKFQYIDLEPEILWRRLFGLSFHKVALEPKILWKRSFACTFRRHFFTCYALFALIWTYKSRDLTNGQDGIFLPAIASKQWLIRSAPGSAPSPAGFIRLILLQSLPVRTPASLEGASHRVEKPSRWALVLKYFRQFMEKQGLRTFCHFCSEALQNRLQSL